MKNSKKFFQSLAGGLGQGALFGGGCLLQIAHLLIVIAAGGLMIWWAVTLFIDGSILWGILVLLIGTPLAVGIANYFAIYLLIVAFIALIIWGIASLIGSDVSFGSVFGSVWNVIIIIGAVIFVSYIIFGIVSSIFRSSSEGKQNWIGRHLNWIWVLTWLLWFVINSFSDVNIIISLLSWVAALLWLIVSGFVIKRKGRSLWWILLSGIASPLWLSNRKDDSKVIVEANNPPKDE